MKFDVKKSACFLLIVLIAVLPSCKYANPKYISEGVIDYNVKPVDENSPMAGYAPGKMTAKFKNNMIAAQMNVMGGIFSTTLIFNPQKKTLTQLVKMLDVKQAIVEDEKMLVNEIKAYELIFEETGEKKDIAGYKCKKVVATKVDDPTDRFDVWYTDELNIKNPNVGTPYHAIEGMLMQYRLKRNELELEFTAVGVEKEKVEDSEFELPSYYKVITKQEMDDFFKSLQ
ncbi:MAG: DUF4412 domain-containing protein [Bacteroidetes bacterium]|nr:DUF4412 domain-containing protein [Bacteroidota bacterium]